jgi:hypothetical protein
MSIPEDTPAAVMILPCSTTRREVGLAPNAAVPAPFNNAGRKCHGRLLAFDADWVGLQAREYDVKVWLPRESVGYVAEIPGTGNH